MSVKNDAMIVGGIALAAVVMGWYAKNKVIQGGGAVFDALNPANNDNIINQGFTDFYQAITGSDSNLGSDYYDWAHPQQEYLADPLMSGMQTAVNVPGTPTYNPSQVATNTGGYVMNPGDAAISSVMNYKLPWEAGFKWPWQ